VAHLTPQDDAHLRQKRFAAIAAEATGLVLVAAFLLATVLLGFWRDLHWSLR
jgi:hypothetical protein